MGGMQRFAAKLRNMCITPVHASKGRQAGAAPPQIGLQHRFMACLAL
jgi:hypothetical protein